MNADVNAVERLQITRAAGIPLRFDIQIVHGASQMFWRFEFAFHKSVVDDDFHSDVSVSSLLLPSIHLLSHGLEVALHLVYADRDAIDERVLGKYRSEQAGNNVSEILRHVRLNSPQADFWTGILPVGSVCADATFHRSMTKCPAAPEGKQQA